jgi:Tfp pilus assembly protein PilF
MGNKKAAEAALVKASELAADNPDYLVVLIEFYIKNGNLTAAKKFSDFYKKQFPQDATADQLLEYLNQNMN